MQADQLLVDRCRAGDRDAFAQIVRRYQTLVCSIAYGATGSLSVSEELAQETFVAAWRSIHDLREPNRLRQWLCGIVRNLANNSARRRQRDVLRGANAIGKSELVDESALDPAEASIAREEADLLDRTLETLPASYREPLVLFYREQQSVARVAELLELSPDAVKQRLARGRRMLRSEVAAVVERGLLQSAPGRAFTIGVLAALPVMSGSAKAATVTVTTAKGVSAMKAAGWTGVLGMILGPLVGLLGGWFGYSMSLKSARSDRERTFIKRMTLWILVLIGIFGVGLTLLLLEGRHLAANNPRALAAGIAILTIGYAVALLATIIIGNRRIARIRREDGTLDVAPDEVAAQMPAAVRTFHYPRVYQSRARLLGLPLVCVRFSGAMGIGDMKGRRAAVGWIAIGDKAYGIVFASGSFAVGGIAFGAVGIGLVSFGGLALGALALGGGAIGWWALGGAAIGWLSFGGMAVAWKAAMGGMAVAHEFALGGLAVGEQVNNELAKAFVADSVFFNWGDLMMTPWSWWALVAILFVPMLLAIRLVGRAGESNADAPASD